MSFAAYDVERRPRKGSFYAQVNTFIDWRPISTIIDKHYQKGLSASGEKPYDGLLLFKMLLIGMWNPVLRRVRFIGKSRKLLKLPKTEKKMSCPRENLKNKSIFSRKWLKMG
ncbi:hypothetical protein [Capnocytophaga canimorsus]|uniref:hypothetical protein n=1 Tax=Capnocytophaga canimorsus TaxID=28188 RepID=UPI0037D5621A